MGQRVFLCIEKINDNGNICLKIKYQSLLNHITKKPELGLKYPFHQSVHITNLQE